MPWALRRLTPRQRSYHPRLPRQTENRTVSEKQDGHGLLCLLKKAGKTFEFVRENCYRAANAGQFMVDLVIAPRGMHVMENITFGEVDLVATEVPGLQWLLNSPKLNPMAQAHGSRPSGATL